MRSPILAKLAIELGGKTWGSEAQLANLLGLIVSSSPSFGYSNTPEGLTEQLYAQMDQILADLPDSWSDGVDFANQIEFWYSLGEITVNHGPYDRPFENSIYQWWTLPTFVACDTWSKFPHLTTPGPYLNAPCVAALMEEDACYQSPWLTPPPEEHWESADKNCFSIEKYSPKPNAKVYEVSTVEDWRALVERFPDPHWKAPDGWKYWFEAKGYPLFSNKRYALVDWNKCREVYDAVHISKIGYLRCAYTQIETEYGISTVAGWIPDLTCWLNE